MSDDRIAEAMGLIKRYGCIDGAHHKAWVLDQIARVLKGDDYDKWVEEMKSGQDGPETFDYDEGIAP